MKIKLVLTAIFLAFFQNIYTQEIIIQPPVDSTNKGFIDVEGARAEQQLKEEKSTEKIATESKNRINLLERNQNRQIRKQNKIEKNQNKIIGAEKSVANAQRKLANQQKRSGRIQQKFTKAKRKNNLTPVEVEKGNVKNAEQQLKIKETEEDIQKAKKRLNKVVN